MNYNRLGKIGYNYTNMRKKKKSNNPFAGYNRSVDRTKEIAKSRALRKKKYLRKRNARY